MFTMPWYPSPVMDPTLAESSEKEIQSTMQYPTYFEYDFNSFESNEEETKENRLNVTQDGNGSNGNVGLDELDGPASAFESSLNIVVRDTPVHRTIANSSTNFEKYSIDTEICKVEPNIKTSNSMTHANVSNYWCGAIDVKLADSFTYDYCFVMDSM